MIISEAHLEALYSQAFPQVAKLIGSMGGNPDIAKDLFHDALVIFIEKQQENKLSLTGSASSYLVGITKMLWYQHLKNHKQEFSLDDEETFETPAIEHAQKEKEEIQHLHNHLKQTGARCLDLLTAYYYDKKSLEEIADELNYKNVRSATVQKYKCIEKLRSQMKKTLVHEAAA